MSSDGKQMAAFTWKPGQSGNPSGGKKPHGFSGRMQALAVLDRVMGKDKNKAKLERYLQKEFDKAPVEFFKTFVMPLLPKESKGLIEGGGRTVEWRSILDIGSEPPAVSSGPVLDMEAPDEG